ncbi:MAG: sensor histidine kinase, partial [Bryobacteraceae bacterium]
LVMPQLRQVASVFVIALMIGTLLALLVSNLVSQSLQTIGRNIERISTGDLEDIQEEDLAAELAELQAKLAKLGREYVGIRDDAENLRSNINSMLQGLEEAVLVFDPDGRLRMAGATAERLLSKSQEELLGQKFEQIFPSWQRLGVAIKDAVRQRSSIREYPVSLNRPNVPPVRLLVNVDLVEDFRRDRASILMTLKNAETRRQLASELNVATRLAAISRLTSGVAHEIKNPLNAMALSLENARMKLRSGGDGVESELDTMSREIARLDRVLNTFVEFNRPLEPHITDCDLNEMVHQLAALLEPEAHSRSVRVQFEPQVPKAPVKGDPELLKQAIRNVMTNGIEAMTRSGHLSIKTYEAFDDYVLSIQDEGDGIPPEIQDRVFHLYFTTKSNAEGVGLAVTFRVVQVHNGSIAFESESGKGTCFRLRFPNGGVKKPDDGRESVGRTGD